MDVRFNLIGMMCGDGGEPSEKRRWLSGWMHWPTNCFYNHFYLLS